MKNAKKVFAMLIVLALAISMAIPVSAATGELVINNAIVGQTYNIKLTFRNYIGMGDEDTTVRVAAKTVKSSMTNAQLATALKEAKERL